MKAFLLFSLAFVLLSLCCVPSLGKPVPGEDEEDNYPEYEGQEEVEPEEEQNSGGYLDESDLYVPADGNEEDDDDQVDSDRKKRGTEIEFTSDETSETAEDLLTPGEGGGPVDEEESNYGEGDVEGEKEIAEAENLDIDSEVQDGEKNEEESEKDEYVQNVEETPQEGEEAEVQVPDLEPAAEEENDQDEDLEEVED